MSGFNGEEPTPTVTLTRANLVTGQAGALVIAAGTPYQILVRDARSLYRWSKPVRDRWDSDRRIIVYHHTGVGVAAKRSARYELNLLTDIARGGSYGLPYNFVVMPVPPFRIYYLNDVDKLWPHTYGHNEGTAIAAYGNYSEATPDQRMVDRMTMLADALASMWGIYVEEIQHRDVFPTECPGANLQSLLPGRYAEPPF